MSRDKAPELASAADIPKMVHELGDMTTALDQADASAMRELHDAFGLEVRFAWLGLVSKEGFASPRR